MAQTPDQTRREIEETRARITEAAEELEERFRETTDWRSLTNKYPLESVAIALAVGLVAGSLLLPGIARVFRSSTRRPERTGEVGFTTALSWVRPIITPVITARLVDYMRKRSK